MYFLDTKLAYQRIVMMLANKLSPDNFRDVEEALVVQYAVNVVSVFWVLCPDLLGLLVFDLQFL